MPAIEVRDAGLEMGQNVEISVSGRMLGVATAALFGPALVWTLVLGSLAAVPGSLLPLLAVTGYAFALALGSILAKRAVAGLELLITARDPKVL